MIIRFFTKLKRQSITHALGPYRRKQAQAARLTNESALATKARRAITSKLFGAKSREDFTQRTFFGYNVAKGVVILILIAIAIGLVFLIYWLQPEPPPIQPAGRRPYGVRSDSYFRFDDRNLRNFTGLTNIISYQNKVVFTGEVVNGVVRGFGELFDPIWDGSLRYRGDFDNNQFHGTGTLYFPDGLPLYRGEFRNNQFHGAGTLYFPYGQIHYRGEFRNNLFHGEGELFSDDGIWRYHGNFVDNTLNGRTRVYYRGSLIYEGDFLDGVWHGFGTYFDSTTGLVRYRGEFQNGNFHGIGTIYDDNGRLLFHGPMLNDRINLRHLLGTSLEDITAMFIDIPIIFYSDGGYVHFFFERAGILISTSTLVYVYENGIPNFQITYGVWQSELELDMSRIFARRITVFGYNGDSHPNRRLPDLPNIFLNNLNNGFLPPPTFEDFIMIDFLQRQGYPIASYFNRLLLNFNINRQSHLFQRIYRICHTIPIYQREFTMDDRFIYRYFFAESFEHVGNEGDESHYPTLIYFSIEFN